MSSKKATFNQLNFIQTLMERREAIKRTAALMGGLIFAPTMMGVLKGCTPAEGDWTPAVFTRQQADLVSALSETILPAGDLPGAIDVGVPGFIDKMVDEVYDEEQERMFLEGLDQFELNCIEETGNSFSDLNPEEQFEYASAVNKESIESEMVEGPQFFLIFKELTMVGFFTSEAGATQVLRYEQVPGYYDGCVPLEEVGRTWATA
jgi:hypothetical protein